MAKYLALIYGDEKIWSNATPEWREQNSLGHQAFAAKAGPAVLGGHELDSSTTATTLRVDSARQRITTDGPFQETKEVLGGYYVLEAADLDEAIKLAWQIPEASAGHSGVELRPIVESS